MIYAQVNTETKELVMFVGFQTVDMAQAHIEENSDCFFVETAFFGSPQTYKYNPQNGKIEPKE